MDQQVPHSLADWHQLLKPLKLPANPQVKIAALQKLKASTGNAINVAAILQEDPALCLILMHEANKTLNQADNETKSLSHTVSLLGFPYVETLLRSTPDYDKATFTQLCHYQQQLSVSLHSAYQLEAWATINPYWPKGETFWATVFQRSAYWALWYQAPEQMLQLQTLRARNKGASISAQEEAVFGCKLHELSRLLSRSWHLPQITQQSWQPVISGSAHQWVKLSQIDPEKSIIAMEEDPELQRTSASISFAIALANIFSDSTQWNWYSRQTLRFQKILANAMHLNVDQAIDLTHQQAIVASRNYTLSKAINPGVQLMGQFNQALEMIREYDGDTLNKLDFSDKQVNLGRQGHTGEADSAASLTKQDISLKKIRTKTSTLLASAPRELTAAISRLQHNADSFVDKQDIFEFALEILGNTLNFERATISVLNRQSKILRSRYSFGCDNSPALRNFRHQLRKGDLFNKLLQKVLSIQLNTSNQDKIWPLLPPEFKVASESDEFLMMSIFKGIKPVAVIYADNGSGASTKIEQTQYYLFKQLCGAVNQCLQNLADS